MNAGGESPDQVRKRFEEAWKAGPRPSIDDYLPAGASRRLAVLVELVYAELEQRLKAGEPARVEEYLRRYPELERDTDEKLSLIACEFDLLRRQDPAISPQHYIDRFPADRADLSRLLVGLPDAPHIPGYTCVEVVGRGGMGLVYKARQEGLKRFVALKMIRAGAHADPEELSRFRTEAEAVARLKHPNIVQIHDVGDYQGQPYVALEYVEGGNLAQKLGGHPQQPNYAAATVKVLAEAVHHAHEEGVVHRDLKPANVLLSRRELLKVSDFGLAKRLDASAPGTVSGKVLGTPNYMAPEQAEGKVKEIDARTDVYGLGAILYEMLTGRPPFKAATVAETLKQVIDNDPVRPGVYSKVPRDLETICLKCLRKEQASRYASADELARDLERFLKGKPIQARPVGAIERTVKWARRRPALAALAVGAPLAVVIILALVFRSMDDRAQAQARELDLDRKRLEEVGAERDHVREEARQRRQAQTRFAVSHGTTHADRGAWHLSLLWFVEALRLNAGDPADDRLHRIRVGAVARGMPNLRHFWVEEQPVRDLTLSADGKSLAVIGADGGVRLWDMVEGTAPGFVIRGDERITFAAFSPDGRRLVTVNSRRVNPPAEANQPLMKPAAFGRPAPGEVRVWDAKTGQGVTGPLRHKDAVFRAAFSPDGSRVVTASRDGTAQVWNTETGRELLILQAGAPVSQADFSPDGRFLVTRSAGRRLDLDSEVRLWSAQDGQPLSFGEGVIERGESITHLAFSQDGHTFATVRKGMWISSKTTTEIWDADTLKRKGKPVSVLERDGFLVLSLALSPQGLRLLVTSGDGPSGRVRMCNTKTGEPKYEFQSGLTDENNCTEAVFSPDGWRIIARADGPLTDPGKRVLVWDSLTGQRVGLPSPASAPVENVVCTPNGDLVVTVTRDHSIRVWDHATTGLPHRSFKHDGIRLHAAFSPDGQRLVTSSMDKTARVWDVRSGQVVTRLAHEGPVHHARLSPDGRRLVTACEDKTARVWDVKTGQALLDPIRHPYPVVDASFSPGGDTLLTLCQENLPLKPVFGAEIRLRGEARVWDARTGAPITPAIGPDAPVNFAAFAPDGRRFLTVHPQGKSGVVQVRDARTGDPLGEPMVHPDAVMSAAFSPDGTLVVTGCMDGTARVWDSQAGRPKIEPIRHDADVWWAGFSPDGQRLVTTTSRRFNMGLSPGFARVWDVADGRPVTSMVQVGPDVRRVGFSPDGRLLVTASGQGMLGDQERTWGALQLWDALTGDIVSPPYGVGYFAFDAEFSPDGSCVLWNGTAPRDKEAMVAEVVPDQRPLEQLQLLAEVLSGQRIDRTGDVVRLEVSEVGRRWQELHAR